MCGGECVGVWEEGVCGRGCVWGRGSVWGKGECVGGVCGGECVGGVSVCGG